MFWSTSLQVNLLFVRFRNHLAYARLPRTSIPNQSVKFAVISDSQGLFHFLAFLFPPLFAVTYQASRQLGSHALDYVTSAKMNLLTSIRGIEVEDINLFWDPDGLLMLSAGRFWSDSSTHSNPGHFVKATTALKSPTETHAGDHRVESGVHNSWFPGWYNHKLVTNNSEQWPKHDLRPRVTISYVVNLSWKLWGRRRGPGDLMLFLITLIGVCQKNS